MCWLWNRRKTNEMLAWPGRRAAISVTDQGDSQGQELGSEVMVACQGTDEEGAVDSVSREMVVSGASPVSDVSSHAEAPRLSGPVSLFLNLLSGVCLTS